MLTAHETMLDRARSAVRYIRENDCDFLTVENVMDYAQMPGSFEARVALTEAMGREWAIAQGVIRPDVVVSDGRMFAVERGGRRWTKVPEHLSNMQRTARWFVDEATGEVRMARSWKSPESWPLTGERAEFVLAIVARADAC